MPDERVTRIVPNLQVADVEEATRFYADTLGLDIAQRMVWIGTLVAPDSEHVQLSTITADATADVTPLVSVGVADVDAAYERVVRAGAPIVYDLTDEEWGVRRFFFRDPDGNVINVVAHRD
ncbi:VOC family protein [uncultured Jatrophihabitans sp.]|uniref:VOC family protein n=1 Tax=uncultured Jatrophihabitans sp. TaxID=1610747 RepID=UPI0035C977FF